MQRLNYIIIKNKESYVSSEGLVILSWRTKSLMSRVKDWLCNHGEQRVLCLMRRLNYIIMENKEFMFHAKNWLCNYGEQRGYVSCKELVM